MEAGYRGQIARDYASIGSLQSALEVPSHQVPASADRESVVLDRGACASYTLRAFAAHGRNVLAGLVWRPLFAERM